MRPLCFIVSSGAIVVLSWFTTTHSVASNAAQDVKRHYDLVVLLLTLVALAGLVAFALFIEHDRKRTETERIENDAYSIARELLELVDSVEKSSDEDSARNAVISEVYRTTYRSRVMRLVQAMKKNGVPISGKVLPSFDDPFSEYQIIKIANGLDRYAGQLHEKNLK